MTDNIQTRDEKIIEHGFNELTRMIDGNIEWNIPKFRGIDSDSAGQLFNAIMQGTIRIVRIADVPDEALDFLKLYQKSATCSQHKVGAAFFTRDWKIALTGGFNTTPLNTNSCKDIQLFFQEHVRRAEDKNPFPVRSVHRVIRDMELHAEDIASRGLLERIDGLGLTGSDINLLVSHMPCTKCLSNVILKLLAATQDREAYIGVINVYFLEPWTNSPAEMEKALELIRGNKPRLICHIVI